MSHSLQRDHEDAAALLREHHPDGEHHATDLADCGHITQATALALVSVLENASKGSHRQRVAAQNILARTPGFESRYRYGGAAIPHGKQVGKPGYAANNPFYEGTGTY